MIYLRNTALKTVRLNLLNILVVRRKMNCVGEKVNIIETTTVSIKLLLEEQFKNTKPKTKNRSVKQTKFTMKKKPIIQVKQKQYREDNKDKIKQINKTYYEKNKEKWNKHYEKHQEALNNLNNINVQQQSDNIPANGEATEGEEI